MVKGGLWVSWLARVRSILTFLMFSIEPVVPMNACSQNIAQIFGTNTTAFELLVLKRKIMGPCWIQIKHPEVDNKGVASDNFTHSLCMLTVYSQISWCKLEVTVTNPKDFNPFSETDINAPKDMPPLNVMSLSVRTIVNHQENKREIVCASARIWHNSMYYQSVRIYEFSRGINSAN